MGDNPLRLRHFSTMRFGIEFATSADTEPEAVAMAEALRKVLKVCLFLGVIVASGPVFSQTYNLGIQKQLALWEQFYGLKGRDAAARQGRDSFYSTEADNGCIGCEDDPLFVRAKYYGEYNDALLDSAFLTEEEEAKYSGVGRIECIKNNIRVTGTGFVAGRYDSLVTAAHIFKGFTKDQCKFVRYDRFGNPIPGEVYSFKKIRSRWEEDLAAARARDPNVDPASVELKNNDQALVRLERYVMGVTGLNLVTNLTEPREVIAVAFHAVGPKESWTRPRKTYGQVYEKTESLDRENENIIIFDATVNGSSSGAPLVNAGDGKVGGIVVGIPPGAEKLGHDFNVRDNYNQAVIFDDGFKKMYLDFVKTEYQ